MTQWKYAHYCRKGLSHLYNGTCCQDRVLTYETPQLIIAALADGVGSKPNSAVAAEAATIAVREWFCENQVQIRAADNVDKYIRSSLIPYVATAVIQRAAEIELPISSMDCNLSFVCLSKDDNTAICGRLGDCAVCLIGHEPIAMTAQIGSANRTDTVLVSNAFECLELNFYKLDNLQGFILTSDGMDDIIYMKGFPCVRKAAQDIFNCVLANDAEAALDSLVQKIIAENPEADDDISIAILSKTSNPIELENDPTWLCSCGHRNELHQSYCQNCGNDITNVYKHCNFSELGGKYGFFRHYNQNPQEEAVLVNRIYTPHKTSEFPWDPLLLSSATQNSPLAAPDTPVSPETPESTAAQTPITAPAAPEMVIVPEPPTAETPLNTSQPEDTSATTFNQVPQNPTLQDPSWVTSSADSSHDQPASIIKLDPTDSKTRFSPLSTNMQTMDTEKNYENNSEKHSSRRGILMVVLAIGLLLGSFACMAMTYHFSSSIPHQVAALLDNSSNENNPVSESGLLIGLDDGTYYYGESQAGVPHGNGMLITDSSYQIGTFINGKKDGSFLIVDTDDPSDFTTETYHNGIIVGSEDDPSSDAIPVEITDLLVVLRTDPDASAPEAGKVRSGDTVYLIAPPLLVEETYWLQVALEANGEPAGWCRISQTSYSIS